MLYNPDADVLDAGPPLEYVHLYLQPCPPDISLPVPYLRMLNSLTTFDREDDMSITTSTIEANECAC